MEKKVDRAELLTAEVRALRQTMGTSSVSSPTRVLRSKNGEVELEAPGSGTKRKRIEENGSKGAKRERTTTWAGRQLRQATTKIDKPTRVTRKSTGPVAVVTKGRRSLSLLGKK